VGELVVEEGFQGHEEYTSIFLNAVGLINKLGLFCGVIDQAIDSSGDLFSYGPANAQFNNLLDIAIQLTVALFQNLKNLKIIAEGRFGYWTNSHGKETHWIAHYNTLPNTINHIGQLMRTISSEIMKIKIEASTITLYEQVQEPQSAITDFVKKSENFARHISSVLGYAYIEPPSPSAVKLPDLKTIDILRNTRTEIPQDFGSARVILNISKTLTEEHNVTENTKPIEKKSIDLSVLDSTFHGPLRRGKNGQVKANWYRGESVLAGTTPASFWFFEESADNWTQYDEKISQKTENCWDNGGSSFMIGDIKINIADRKQIQPIGRKIRRGTWFYKSDDGKWVPYDEPTAEGLEASVQNYDQFAVKIADNPPKIIVGENNTFKEYSAAKGKPREVCRGYHGQVA